MKISKKKLLSLLIGSWSISGEPPKNNEDNKINFIDDQELLEDSISSDSSGLVYIRDNSTIDYKKDDLVSRNSSVSCSSPKSTKINSNHIKVDSSLKSSKTSQNSTIKKASLGYARINPKRLPKAELSSRFKEELIPLKSTEVDTSSRHAELQIRDSTTEEEYNSQEKEIEEMTSILKKTKLSKERNSFAFILEDDKQKRDSIQTLHLIQDKTENLNIEKSNVNQNNLIQKISDLTNSNKTLEKMIKELKLEIDEIKDALLEKNETTRKQRTLSVKTSSSIEIENENLKKELEKQIKISNLYKDLYEEKNDRQKKAKSKTFCI